MLINIMSKPFSATAMILAAGRGERMKPLTDAKPKPLLEVNGKPLIAYHLERLAQNGVQQVVINIAWLGKLIKQALGDGAQFGLAIHYCDEGEQALETAGGVINALPYLADQFWLLNADVYSDYCLPAITLKSSLAQLVLVNNPGFHPKGDFGIDKDLLVSTADKQFTFSGLGYYKKAFFADLSPGKRALAPIIRQHAKKQLVKAILYRGEWSDVGTPQRLNELQISD